MILSALKEYVMAHPKCSGRELAKHFSLSEDGIEAMMASWVKRGHVKIIIKEERGKVEKRYLWVDGEQLGITIL